MSQFNAVRSAKAASDLDARLRRHKLLEHGRTAFVDRPDDGVRGRRLVPRLFPEGRQANATYASRMMHEARPAPQGIRGRPVTRTTAITAGRRSARIQP
jgi:hypothetical protein